MQPWRATVVTGAALTRLTAALLSAVSAGIPPTTEPLKESYVPYRSALGKLLYGPQGYDVPREDTERLTKLRLRNYTFFDAPCAVVVYMEKGMAQADVLSVGIWVQSLCVLLAEQGLATCVEVSVAGYPQVSSAFCSYFDGMS
jgi:nitroreductase